MVSTRLLMMLATALLTGAAGACIAEQDTAPATVEHAERAGTAITAALAEEATWAADPSGPSLFEHVTDLARSRAAAAWRPPDSPITEAVAALTYGQYRGIRFRTESTIWREESLFQLQLFHPGGGNERPVRIHLVEDGASTTVAFDPAFFSYGDELDDVDVSIPREAGYAGLRVLYPLNRPDKMDEVVSFLGASYFRLLGPDQVYGLSSRGVAVDTGDPDGEEFPAFTDFWVVRGAPDDRSLTLYALLDGPSLTGAFHFELTPGTGGGPGEPETATDQGTHAAPGVPASPGAAADRPSHSGTVMAVDATFFARTDVGKLGVAPLTSMYLHGTFSPGGDDDFRPRVHDSEGLLMRTAVGEWIWRPLTNRSGVRFTSLSDIDPLGFGLVQRSRDFGSYMDLETQYHRRPSEWVATDGAWGRGAVELVEIPTRSEFNDNIVAYWRPDEPFRAGEERRYRYRLETFDATRPEQAVAHVARTRIGWDALPGQTDPPPRSRRRVVVDFTGGRLTGLDTSVPVDAVIDTSAGTISDLRVERLPDGGRRATFSLDPDGDRGSDMRLYLQVADTAVTETWSYLWEPSGAH